MFAVTIYRSYRYFDENVFKEDVNAIQWDDLCTNEESVEQMWHNFRYRFKEICDRHAPYVTVNRSPGGHHGLQANI